MYVRYIHILRVWLFNKPWNSWIHPRDYDDDGHDHDDRRPFFNIILVLSLLLFRLLDMFSLERSINTQQQKIY